jgi:hypothetical protein
MNFPQCAARWIANRNRWTEWHTAKAARISRKDLASDFQFLIQNVVRSPTVIMISVHVSSASTLVSPHPIAAETDSQQRWRLQIAGER